MKNFTRNKQLKSKILDYLRMKFPDNTYYPKGMFECPFKDKHQGVNDKPSAHIYPEGSWKLFCFDPACRTSMDIYDLCRKLDFDGNKDVDDKDIEDYLLDLLDLKINNETSELFKKYAKWGWSLFPTVKNTKVPMEEEWQKKTHKDPAEWMTWINNNQQVSLNCGEKSNTIVIDCDLITKEEAEIILKGTATKTIEEFKQKKADNLKKVEAMSFFKDTAKQDSGLKGVHFFFKYDPDIQNCQFTYDGINFDILSDNHPCLVEPSTFKNITRVISGEEILPFPEELKKFILTNSKTENKPTEINDDDIIDFGSEKIKGLDGVCNKTFVSILGQIRKFMPIDKVERTAHILNKQLLDKPMENRAIQAMCGSINKYYKTDIGEIGRAIITHLEIVKNASVRDLKDSLGFERKDIEISLKNLIDENLVIKVTDQVYSLKPPSLRQTNFLEEIVPLPYEVPIVGKYTTLNKGSIIIIGAETGSGKTHLAINILERYIRQKIEPRPLLITTEPDGGMGEVAVARGLIEGDFDYVKTHDPLLVDFKENELVVIDWLTCTDGEYHKMEKIFGELSRKISQSKGVLIVFMQLRTPNKEHPDPTFYAQNMVMHYGSFVCKFLHPKINGKKDNLHPYLEAIKVRRSKVGTQFFTIPLEYNYKTKEIIELKNEVLDNA